VRWRNEEFSITEMVDDQELLDHLDRRCQEIGEDSDGRPVVCSITLIGPGPLHHNLNRPGYVDALLEQFRLEHGSNDPPVWVDRLRVETTPEFDREERKRAQDFAAALLQVVDEVRGDPAAIGEIRGELGPLQEQVQKALGSGFPVDDAKLLTWLNKAEAMSLDLLEGGRG
jgi:hypothetical protein